MRKFNGKDGSDEVASVGAKGTREEDGKQAAGAIYSRRLHAGDETDDRKELVACVVHRGLSPRTAVLFRQGLFPPIPFHLIRAH
jgi:hypothetical protein